MIENNVTEEKLLNKKRSVKDLADYIKIRSGSSPNYSLFLGAGASVTSGIRTGYQLVEEWRQEIYCRLSSEQYFNAAKAKEWLAEQHPDWYDQNNEYSSLFEKKFDLPSQRRRFVELQVDKKLPSIGYAYLVELFESKFFDTVFTTNFDDLINEAFYQFSSDRPLLCAHDSSIKGISVTSSRPKIIKLHGDYLFDSIKSSLRETESLENNTREKLVEFTKEYGLIFIGYAGNDNSIMDVLKYLLKQEDYLRNGIYWCKRKGDQITPELFKLLNQDKVYWVEIDGFDEFMAELVHQLGHELSFGGIQKSTKREKMIHNFIKDEYNLKDNRYIQKDLVKIKKHTLTEDISSLINELSESDSDDQKIPEEEFKNLLSIDNLIRAKNYPEAEEKLSTLISAATNDNIKSKYLRRLIDIKEYQKDTKTALELSDKLIELDQFNLNYAISKTNIFPELKDKVDYLKELQKKFKYSINVKNLLCRIALSHSESHNEQLVSFKEIHSLLDENLKQDNGLDNDAWVLKYDAIMCEHLSNFDKTEQNKKTTELLDTIKKINPLHDTYLYTYSQFSCKAQTKADILKCIDVLSDAYEISSKGKRRNILKHLTQLYTSLFETDYDADTPNLMEKFIKKYEEDTYVSAIAPFILFKARYEIGCKKSIDKGISLVKVAMDSSWRNNYIQKIVDILMIDKNNLPIIEDFIETLPKDTSEVVILKIKIDIAVKKGEYTSALELYEEALTSGIDYCNYIMGTAYINLVNKNYTETIRIADSYLEKIKDFRERDVLVINREIAKKKLGLEISKHEIRSILAHHKSKGDVAMCAFFLLDDELNGNRQLQSLIEQDYINFYNFSEWPGLPENILSRFQLVDNHAA
ncbi:MULTISPECIES: SIR2 family protein [Atlantibacter]|uniref:SIR2 family protein n=1 Tax=Atlantibacter TaxID=1903434 RepID=UPI002540F018|nr:MULTISPECIES: SIR2 family protein [Bacteria]WIF58807.1 SIR2 family protein [Atlantibacter hermannii]